MCKSSDRIPLDVAARILGVRPQALRQMMAKKQVNIGAVIEGGARNHRNQYLIFRPKLAKLLGYEPDHHWEEENEKA